MPDLPPDPTYGYSLERLLAVEPPPEPAGFAAFWRETFEQAAAVPPRPALRLVPSPSARWEAFELEFDGLGGFRVGGWLVRPRERPVRCGFVVGHGYGGRAAPDAWLPAPDAAAVFPCARGFYRSAHPGLPATVEQHVVHGIDSRDTYLHRFCAADLWSAASALLELVPEAGERLYYQGGSFGGGIGALALPWDARFQRAYLGVPSFGHHPLRLGLPCVGSGESVRRLHAERPEVADTLAWFDAATAARHVRVPVLVGAAVADPAVPPPGQFAVYNALGGPKELFVFGGGHMEYEGQAAEQQALARRLETWFDEETAPDR